MSQIKEQVIEKMIYVIRDQKVMMDKDLADLYEVETKVLNQAVKRNISRFPSDFMFQVTTEECENLRSQIVTSSLIHGGRRYLPYVFTENGVAMLSSVLSSEKAIQINVSIMRIFTRLRSFLMLEKDLSDRVSKLEQGTNQMFKVVFERLDNYEELTAPRLPANRKKLGLK
ncbi:MAG: ORF6N domain-containing protein [Bacteriovoracia bacterium]